MGKVFFTADQHLGHNNIIKHCDRPFGSVEEMNEAIIKRTNEVVKRGDVLYVLGDLAWHFYDLDDYFGRLNTKEVHLIWGNHDDERRRHPSIRSYHHLTTVKVRYLNKRFALCHYAMRVWPGSHHGTYHLYGHSHGTLPGIGRSMDVGVDTNDFYPYSAEEVVERIENGRETDHLQRTNGPGAARRAENADAAVGAYG